MTNIWFEDSVAEAVSTVTAKDLILLVYIYGNNSSTKDGESECLFTILPTDDSEQSKQLESTLLDDEVCLFSRETPFKLLIEFCLGCFSVERKDDCSENGKGVRECQDVRSAM